MLCRFLEFHLKCDAGELVSDCCTTYLVDGIRYVHKGSAGGKPYYYSNDDNLYLIFVDWMESWYHSTSNDLYDFYYYDTVRSTASCPPMLNWLSGTTVTCLSNGILTEPTGLETFSIHKIYQNVPNFTSPPEKQSSSTTISLYCSLLALIFL